MHQPQDGSTHRSSASQADPAAQAASDAAPGAKVRTTIVNLIPPFTLAAVVAFLGLVVNGFFVGLLASALSHLTEADGAQQLPVQRHVGGAQSEEQQQGLMGVPDFGG